MKTTLFLFLSLFFALPAFADLPTHAQDTSKLRKIVIKYMAGKKQKKDQDTFSPHYAFEGDSTFKALNAKNLLQDIQIQKYRKQIKKARRQNFWANFWGIGFGFVLPALLLISIILIAIFAKLVFWQGLFVVVGGLALIFVSFMVGLGFAFTQIRLDNTFEYIIREYNEEVMGKKE